MTPTRWRHVQRVLDEILTAPAAERAPRLDALCGDDAELRREVISLLDLEPEVDAFLDTPVVAALAGPEADVGRRVGAYRLIELLGQGGMGAVYRAARQDDFEFQAAIKLVHPSAVQQEILRRFHTERQILARLEHPHIARLLDGGAAEDGRPYLVMEYVDGEPIDTYCDRHQLDIPQRLLLFEQACEAVAYAHRSLVVHRDLKPANVLVTEEGQVKLLDFGIAKWLADDEPGLTLTRERPMTPRWASPEQVLRQPITTASDIYGVGLLLHHLLTGRLPCGLDVCTDIEIPERVCQREPDRPSTVTRHRDSPAAATEPQAPPEQLASRRGCESPAALRRQLTGDLDAIVLRALRKEPDQRYASVERLAEDLENHRSGFPVRARRGTLVYRWGKYLRRRRWALLAAASLLAAALLAGWREVERLETERRRADQMAGFLKGMLDAADPDAGGPGFDALEMLDGARAELSTFEEDPALTADLADILADLYHRRGHYTGALELLELSVAAQRRATPGNHATLAKRLNNLAALHLQTAHYPEAEAALRAALEMHESSGDTSDAAVVTANNLATALLYRGHFEEAEALYRRGLRQRAERHGPRSAAVASSRRSLAALHLSRGDLDEAETAARQALELRRELFGEDHTAVASVLALLGSIERGLGEPERAAETYGQALELRRRRLGPDHILVSRSQRFLAESLIELGELDTARVLLTHSLQTLAATTRPEDWRRADTEGVLGYLWAVEGQKARPEPCLREAAETLSRVRGPKAWQTRQATDRWQRYQSSPAARNESR